MKGVEPFRGFRPIVQQSEWKRRLILGLLTIAGMLALGVIVLVMYVLSIYPGKI